MSGIRDIVSKQLFDLSPEAVVILDLKGIIIDVNDRVTDWLGYEKDEVMGKNFMATSMLPAKSKAIIAANFAKRISGKELKPYEVEFNKKNGETLPVMIRAILLKDKDGKKLAILAMISEVSGMHKEREKIKSERDEIRKYIDLAGVMFIALNNEGNVSLINKEACRVLGYKEEEILGKNWFDTVIPKNNADEIRSVFNKIMHGEIEGLDRYESEIVDSSGNLKLISWHNTTLRDNEGKISETLSSGEDITEERLKEKEYKETQEKYENVVRNSSQLFYIHDTNNVLTYVSPYCQKMFGYDQDEMMRKWTDLASDNPINKEGVKKTEDTIKSGEMQDPYELELVRKDGEKFWVEVREAPIKNDEGLVVAITGALRDITKTKEAEEKLKESEERLRAIFENSPDAIYIYEKNGVIVDGNSAALKLMGGVDKNEFVGKNIFNIGALDPKDIPRVMKGIATLMMGKSIGPDRFKIKRPDGRTLILETRSFPVEVGGNRLVMDIARDVTEIEESAGKVAKAEMELSSLFNNMSEGVMFHELIRDDEGRVVNYKLSRANPAFSTHTGLDASELMGKLATEAYGVSEPPYLDRYSRVVENQKEERFETYFEPHGRYYSISAVPFGNNHFATVFSDITNKKETERELIESESMLRDLFENATDLIQSVDKEGRYVFVNKAWKDKLGYTDEEAVNMSFFDVVDAEHLDQCKSLFDELKSGMDKKFIDTVFISKNGNLIKVEGNISALKEGGKFVSTRGFFRDVTIQREAEIKLKESEERLRQVMEHSREWVWEVDKDGLYTFSSPMVEELLGRRVEEVVGKMHFYDFFLDEERESLKNTALDAFGRREEIKGFENKNLRSDGEIIWLSTYCSPVLNNNGELVGYRGVDLDITAQKEAEEKLKKEVKNFERMNKLMVGREIKMAELKKKIREYEQEKHISSSGETE